MKNQVEIPVSRELKEKYAHSLDMIDFKVVRAFDPVRQYKYISVPSDMTFEVFHRVVARDFGLDDLNSMLLDMQGDQVQKTKTTSDLARRYGTEYQISAYQYAVQYYRE